MQPLSILNLFPGAFIFVRDQIRLSVSKHKMYSDFNQAPVDFLTLQCPKKLFIA